MAQEPALHGLCLTCRHGSFCGLSHRSPTPVLQCNEFEIIEFQPPQAASERDSLLSMRDSKEDRRKDDISQYKGLCVNCELRDTCTYTKPPSGIWHCNEYQ